MNQAQVLEQFDRDSNWFYKNTDKLRKDGYTWKFVAIKNSQPISSNKNIDIVIEELEEKGENPSLLFIEFVYPEDYVLIL